MSLADLIQPPESSGMRVRFGEVTDDDPLRVQWDGDAGATGSAPITLVPVGVSDRVAGLFHDTRVTVIGRVSPSAAAYSLDSLSDVDASGAAAGQHLVHDGTSWKATTPPTPVLRLRAGRTSPVMNSTNKTVSVSYGATFATAPRVFVQFAQDMPDCDATAENATTTGFTLRLRGTATNNSVEVNWLAVLDGSFSI